MARQFNLIPPICEQAEYHMFQREKVEVQLPELFHKIGMTVGILPYPPKPQCSPSPVLLRPGFMAPGELETAMSSPSSTLSPGVGAMTWSPLACGIVSGKYDGGIPPYSRASLKVSCSRAGRAHRHGQSWGSRARGLAKSLQEQELQEPQPREFGDALPVQGAP